MSGIYYAVFTLGILVIIHWYIQNERAGAANEGNRGFLAMREPGTPPPADKPGADPRPPLRSNRPALPDDPIDMS